MTFDSSISDNISLLKILDAFIIDNEAPSIIISFLKQHDAAFKDILDYSLYDNRIFQLDFFLHCNENEQTYLLAELKDVSINDAAILSWQILKSKSIKVQAIKYKLRKNLQWILANGPRHPYSYNNESLIAPLDNTCFKAAETNSIDDIPLLVQNSKLNKYFSNISHSLFQNRLLQYDFLLILI